MIASYIIISANDLNLNEREDQKEFTSIFSKWIYKSTKNIKSIVGYVINQDWSTEEDTKNDTKTTN